MKNIKNAFSLFELLIVLAIISVLTVMLVSISKQGLESAYNRYYYASYKAMADAISYSNDRIFDANANGQTTDNELNYYYIGYALGFKTDSEGRSIKSYQQITNGKIIYPRTSNGVQYTIESSTNGNYQITANLPSTNKEFNATFIYVPDANGGMLIPYQATPNGKAKINLYERKDLLPFYIDNGINGRSYKAINKGNNNNYSLGERDKNNDTKRTYNSFINTYCSLSTKTYDDESNTLSQNDDKYAKESKDKILNALGTSCSTNGNVKGFIKVANPQKVL